jgi:hypothetical protein
VVTQTRTGAGPLEWWVRFDWCGPLTSIGLGRRAAWPRLCCCSRSAKSRSGYVLATEKLLLVDAELVGLALFELSQDPGQVASITAKASELLKKRRHAIDDFIQKASVALNVPHSRLIKNRP